MKLEEIISGIRPVDEEAKRKTRERADSLIKPIGSLGKLEDIAVAISGITGKVKNNIEKKCTVVMCSDNGVVEEGVASSPQEITAVQTENIIRGISGVGVLSKAAKSDLKVVDIGIKSDLRCPGLVVRKVERGTANMAKGSAMTREQAVKAMEIGIDIVEELVIEGYGLIGTGEMGIGNTSTSSAVTMAFLNCGTEAVGKGAGLTEEEYEKKKRVVEKAIELNCPDRDDPIDVVSKVGGFDIAGLAGCFLAAAYYRVPIVVDGMISAAAALAASRLNPLVKDYLLPSHISREPAFNIIMKELEIEPFLNLDMRLGEGSGCPLGFQVIEAACTVLNDMASFDELSMDSGFLIDIR